MTPIVTTRCEGLAELIDGNGLVVEPDVAEEIAKAVRKLDDNRQLHKQMSITARNRAEQFSWSNVAKQYIQKYRTINHRKDNSLWD